MRIYNDKKLLEADRKAEKLYQQTLIEINNLIKSKIDKKNPFDFLTREMKIVMEVKNEIYNRGPSFRVYTVQEINEMCLKMWNQRKPMLNEH